MFLIIEKNYDFFKNCKNSKFFEPFSSQFTADLKIEYYFSKLQYFRYSQIWNIKNEKK